MIGEWREQSDRRGSERKRSYGYAEGEYASERENETHTVSERTAR